MTFKSNRRWLYLISLHIKLAQCSEISVVTLELCSNTLVRCRGTLLNHIPFHKVYCSWGIYSSVSTAYCIFIRAHFLQYIHCTIVAEYSHSTLTSVRAIGKSSIYEISVIPSAPRNAKMDVCWMDPIHLNTKSPLPNIFSGQTLVYERHVMDSHRLVLFKYRPIISITDHKIASISQLSWHAQNSVAITLIKFSLAYLRYLVIWVFFVGTILICLTILTIPALFYIITMTL